MRRSRPNPLLGVGFGREFLFVAPLPDLSWWPFWHYEPHHNILWVWLKTGALGFIAFWILIGTAIARAAFCVETLKRLERRASFAILALAGIISTMVFCYVDLGLVSGRVTVFLGTLLGTLAVLISSTTYEAIAQGSRTTRMHVSVVICTRNRPDLIGTAVASVLANTYPVFDLLVVDQSDDAAHRARSSAAALSEHPQPALPAHHAAGPLARLQHRHPRTPRRDPGLHRRRLRRARRTGLRRSSRAFEAEPEADMLYGQVALPACARGPTARSCRRWPSIEPQRLSRRDGFRIYGMGANFAARRRLFERIGGFDEMLGGGGPLRSSQDFDLSTAPTWAAPRSLLRPDVTGRPLRPAHRRAWPATLRAYGIGDGAFYFKHVRCGDLFALRLLTRQARRRMAVREALRSARHRKRGSQQIYLKGCLEGIARELRYPVDRRRRLYGPALPLAEGSAA